MKMKFRPYLLVPCAILLLLLQVGELRAQGQAEPGWINVSLSVVTNNVPIRGLYYKNGGEWVQLDVPTVRSSPAFEYRGPEHLAFYTQPYNPEEAIPPPLASVHLKRNEAEQALVFFHGDISPDEIKVLSIADSARAFPTENLLLYNMSQQLVVGLFNDNMKQVPARSSAMEPYGDGSRRGFRIQLAVQEQEHGDWKRVYATGFPIFPDYRWLVIWFGQGKEPWLLMLRDRQA